MRKFSQRVPFSAKLERKNLTEADFFHSSDYNLPPSKIAASLPARQKNKDSKGDQTTNQTNKPKKTKKTQSSLTDDTPKAFARLLQQYQKKTNPNPDTENQNNGENQSRKRKRGGDNDNEKQKQKQKTLKKQQPQPKPSSKATTEQTTTQHEIPKILPGERMSDFAARVDRSLPLSMITKAAANSNNNNTHDPKDAKVRKLREDRQTKHERRLRRMQREWRVEDAKIRERREEEMEEKDAANEEINEQWKEWEKEAGKGAKKKAQAKKKTNKKKKKGPAGNNGEDSDDDKYVAASDGDDDPWAKLNHKGRSSQSNPFDVVQAPPEKLKKPREIFKVHGMGGAKVHVADVPTAAGSLRQREQLATERQTIVEEYRKLMASKRGK